MNLPPIPPAWLTWLSGQQDGRTQPGSWLAVSLFLYLAGSWLWWWACRGAHPHRGWRQGLRAVYYLAPPYAAVIAGVLSARNLGLVIAGWPEGLSAVTPLGIVLLSVVVMGGWALRQ